MRENIIISKSNSSQLQIYFESFDKRKFISIENPREKFAMRKISAKLFVRNIAIFVFLTVYLISWEGGFVVGRGSNFGEPFNNIFSGYVR